jgi:hypothetical protein
MKKFTIVAVLIAALILLIVLIWPGSDQDNPSAYQGTTQMVLSGTTGVVFTGHYVQDGRRIALSNALPWEFEGERVSSLEIRKLNPDETLVVELRYDSDSAHATMKKSLGPDALGMRVQVRHGLISETVSRAQ